MARRGGNNVLDKQILTEIYNSISPQIKLTAKLSMRNCHCSQWKLHYGHLSGRNASWNSNLLIQ